MVTTISGGVRTARKHHPCFECYRAIAPRQKYGFQTNVYGGIIYTLVWHLDCRECANKWRAKSDNYYDDDGFPPLREEWRNGGGYDRELEWWRGLYPHVVARMELTDQLREARK